MIYYKNQKRIQILAKRWSEKQDDFLIKYYGITKVQVISKLIGRTERATVSRANKLGLRGKTKSRLGRENHLEWLKTSEYSIQEEYILSSTKVLHMHNTCGHIWKVSPNNLRKLVGCPKCSKKAYSKMAIDWINSYNNPNIQHAENGGEILLMGFYVDGFDPTTNTVYEFHGNVWHGNPLLFDPDDKPHPFNNKTAEELYTSTLEKTNTLKTKYNVIEMWESEWKTLRGTQSNM